MKAKDHHQAMPTAPRAMRDYATRVVALSAKAAAQSGKTAFRRAKAPPASPTPWELRELHWEGEGGALSRR